MDTYLQTERVTLRRFGIDEADLLIELDSDPAVMRYLSGGAPTPPELYRDGGVAGIVASYDRWAGAFGLFAAYETADDAFVGWFCLRPERDGPLDEVELGYRLRQAAWGRGLATEVSAALLAKAFTELDVRLVWGETMALNHASQHVMEKVGMVVTQTVETPEDMLAVEGAELGGFRYEITREQWDPEQGARRP
ncbi:GNAT family N-acetyltransferase [Luteimicrobium subarcticum]|uniref:RimJ/RimL family protein N-acetyltransferase n=1 Tax=Luteimicrobium subarcticum TaxID=620910 RepID=A0A2M8W6N9_9MICO|nr:GNAT family N-acetyltransferase [Luteimicrobium subarcticum]PJI86593.1 RimJ/RimL family protein N-acetyltransferase [Luteimicrobium subarcticum]